VFPSLFSPTSTNKRRGTPAVIRYAFCGILLVILPLGCGVTTVFSPREMFSSKDRTSNDVRIRRILPLWSITSQQDSSGLQTRGFLGTIMFFGTGSDQSQQIDEGARVLISEREGEDWQLKRKFIITPEALSKKQNSTALGEVYELFVPHDISPDGLYGIVVEYTATDGTKVVSPATKVP
jgi:hypothetical protein